MIRLIEFWITILVIMIIIVGVSVYIVRMKKVFIIAIVDMVVICF